MVGGGAENFSCCRELNLSAARLLVQATTRAGLPGSCARMQMQQGCGYILYTPKGCTNLAVEVVG